MSRRPHRLEPGRPRIAFEHACHVHQIDRLVVDLAFAKLNQALDEAAEAESLGIDGGHQILQRGSARTGGVPEDSERSAPICKCGADGTALP
jgi:hypothetical protein